MAGFKLGDHRVWEARLDADRERAARNQAPALATITDALQEQAKAAGAQAFVLSGSTARGRRTRVSDLDYHVIGISSLEVENLPGDIDLFTDKEERFIEKLRGGDDLAHWSLWYGCVLFDSGDARSRGIRGGQDLWPDAERKRRQAMAALDFAARMAATGDYAASLEMIRGALTLTARWILLRDEIFPLARDELSGQLRQLGHEELALALGQTIHERPELDSLEEFLVLAHSICQEPGRVRQRIAESVPSKIGRGRCARAKAYKH